MKAKLLQSWVSSRAADLRAATFAYTGASVATLFLIRDVAGYGDEMKAALVVAIVGFGLNALAWFDGALADIAASRSSMDEDMANSDLGKNFKKAPFVVFRGLAASIVIANTVAQSIVVYA